MWEPLHITTLSASTVIKIIALQFTILLYPLLLWPPVWSSGQSFWIQIQRSWFDSRRYQIFWEILGLERVPLSFVGKIEELLERKSSGSGLETEITAVEVRCAKHATPFYPQKLALTSPTSGGRSVGIVSSRTKSAELLLLLLIPSVAVHNRRLSQCYV
jgi:hypothetical protein